MRVVNLTYNMFAAYILSFIFTVCGEFFFISSFLLWRKIPVFFLFYEQKTVQAVNMAFVCCYNFITDKLIF